MNGRALGDRAIEVSPSSARVLERAAEILTPFPVFLSLEVADNLAKQKPTTSRGLDLSILRVQQLPTSYRMFQMLVPFFVRTGFTI